MGNPTTLQQRSRFRRKLSPSVSKIVAVSFAMMLAACSDASRVTDAGSLRTAASVGETEGTQERQALTLITRAVALTLGDDGVRQNLKNALRNAPYREHKLELRKYLVGSNLATVASRVGMTAQQLTSVIESVRPLELYMPAADHRSAWIGGSDLLVASMLEDSSSIVAFNLRGERVPISRDIIPSTPTMSIVPVETRFDQPLNMVEWRNENDQNGQAIGTLVSRRLLKRLEECGDGCLGGGGSYGYQPPGFYMTYSHISDLHEPWIRGDPEIEVHVHGPQDVNNSQYGADLSCSGEHALPEKTFDQNNPTWTGSVMIWSAQQEADFSALFSQGYHVLFWEDDNQECVIRTDAQVLRSALGATAAFVGGVALKVLAGGPISGLWILSSLLVSDFFSASWLTTNDDFVGALVPGSDVSGANYSIYDGTTLNGWTTIVVR